MTERLQKLSDAGVSIWLDDLSRERLDSGNLEELIKEKSVVGVTTNPTIFAAALSNGEAYDTHIRELAADGTDVKPAVKSIMAADVRDACDRFTAVFEASDGFDGRVSIEVDATLAEQTQPTIDEARELWAAVDRPNCLIKVPATKAGLPAITATIAAGISVNVTLIFGLDRYRAVIEAYLSGLEQAATNGHDLSRIHSVASFFVSRVDAEVDKRLDAIGGEATELKGKAAVANARLAHQLFRSVFTDGGDDLAPRWKALEAQGARPQRPLWASTGVKNPDYSDTMYVDDLVTTGVVNTMPEKTLDAVADHGELRGDTVINTGSDAQTLMDRLAEVGIDMDEVVEVLEVEGVEKFVKSGEELLETVRVALETAQRTPDSGGPV